MSYLITGATGLVGQQLLTRLLKRRKSLYCLVKDDDNRQRLLDMAAKLNQQTLIIPIMGNLRDPLLGLSETDLEHLKGNVTDVIHLACDRDFGNITNERVKRHIYGTEQVIACGHAIGAKRLHHLSSIAAAGLYRGCFDETMFSQAEQLTHPYFLSHHLCEKVVRQQSDLAFRIYRPGFIVGDSQTGQANRVQGPYYFFKLMQRLGDMVPKWMPLAGFEGGCINIVPADYVADALDCLIHTPDLDGQCFHLTDNKPYLAGEVLNLISKANRGPTLTLKFNMNLGGLLPQPWLQLASQYPPIAKLGQRVLADLGIPQDLWSMLNYPTRFDNHNAKRILDAAGIRCPDLASYINPVWDYWERNLDPELFIEQAICAKLANKVVMITGAGSGIGRACAQRLATTGAKLILVGRRQDKLEETLALIEAKGGKGLACPCDLTQDDAVKQLISERLSQEGNVDVLINCAGRSIRRSVQHSTERMHDYERTMAINYFARVRLILGLIETMASQGRGHIINVSSIGVLTNAPRFSAYVASNSALEAFCRCAGAEYADRNVSFTTINMPLVDTPMSAPTELYQAIPTLSAAQAADLIAKAVVKRPKRIATRLGIVGATLHALSPTIAESCMNMLYRLFPESGEIQPNDKHYHNQQQIIGLAAMLRGIHF